MSGSPGKKILLGSLGDTVEGMSVFVCQMAVDDSCYPCGVIRKTEVASWATVHCTGGMIEGDQVLITHSYRRLQFCDVKIYGLQLGENLVLLQKLIEDLPSMC